MQMTCILYPAKCQDLAKKTKKCSELSGLISWEKQIFCHFRKKQRIDSWSWSSVKVLGTAITKPCTHSGF